MYQLKVVREQVPESIAYYGAKLNNSEDVASIARSLLANEDQEVFLAFMIDAQGSITGYIEIARGGINSCEVDPRVLFRSALVCAGTIGFVASHNHPSGNLEPSKQDDALTAKMREAGHLLGIELIDHVIVSGLRDKHYSYARDGKL